MSLDNLTPDQRHTAAMTELGLSYLDKQGSAFSVFTEALYAAKQAFEAAAASAPAITADGDCPHCGSDEIRSVDFHDTMENRTEWEPADDDGPGCITVYQDSTPDGEQVGFICAACGEAVTLPFDAETDWS
jgi:hypothetical protein